MGYVSFFNSNSSNTNYRMASLRANRGADANSSYLTMFTANSGAPAESLRLNGVGTVILKGGSTSATGVGIAFPATQSQSNDVNTLDDYEEGTWTPTLSGAFSSLTYSSQQGRYIKIGSFVYATFFVQINAVSGGSGNMSLGGAPFASASSGPNPGGYVSLVNGWTTNNPSTFDCGGSGSTDYNIFYRSTSNGVTTSLPSSAAAASAYIRGTLYFYTNT
jgi:hypothetical protein